MRPHTEAATGKKKKKKGISVQDNEIIGSGLLKNKSSETDFSYCTSKTKNITYVSSKTWQHCIFAHKYRDFKQEGKNKKRSSKVT